MRLGSRTINAPEPGHWLVKLVKNGPLVPARIWLNDRAQPCAEVIDEAADPATIWHRRGHPIDEDDFRKRVAEILWYRANRPNHPLCKPREPVNIMNAVRYG